MRLDQAARLILRDPELARDAVQEGLIRAWRDLPKLRDPDRFDAWLHRLTVNACLDLARRRRRRVIEVELTPIHAPAVAGRAPARDADRELVDGVLRRLDERGRAIVVLHYYLGLPLTDVAATLGIPIGTVKSRLHRALGEMRVAIGRRRSGAASCADGRAAGMTTGRRLERDLPTILDELAMSPYPDYIDNVLTTTARTAPAAGVDVPRKVAPHDDLDFTGGAVAANARCGSAAMPRAPPRRAGGGRRADHRLAAARCRRRSARRGNGLVAYDAGGDIYTADPVTGVSTAIITGPETDVNPRCSRDGTHIAFERKAVGDSGPGLVYVARADGSDVVRLDTAAPVAGIDSYYFSPDGTQLLISYEGGLDAGIGYPSVLIAATDGSGFRDLGMTDAGRLCRLAAAGWLRDPVHGRRRRPRDQLLCDPGGQRQDR